MPKKYIILLFIHLYLLICVQVHALEYDYHIQEAALLVSNTQKDDFVACHRVYLTLILNNKEIEILTKKKRYIYSDLQFGDGKIMIFIQNERNFEYEDEKQYLEFDEDKAIINVGISGSGYVKNHNDHKYNLFVYFSNKSENHYMASKIISINFEKAEKFKIINDPTRY